MSENRGQNRPPNNSQDTTSRLVDIPEHKETSPAKKIFIVSFGFLSFSALIIGGYYLYGLLANINKPATTPIVEKKPSSSASTPTPDTTLNWKTYRNDEFGFILKYPQFVTLNNNILLLPINIPTLKIDVQTFEQIKQGEQDENNFANYNLGYDSQTFIEDVLALEQGQYGGNVDFDFPSSRNVVSLGTVKAKTFTILGRFETCDVTFERIAIIYPEGRYRIIINLYGPFDQIINENSPYFETRFDGLNKWKNCDSADDESEFGQTRFYNDLVKGKTSPNSQAWYDTFDQILSTLEFSTNASNWKNYANNNDKFSLKYPSNWDTFDFGNSTVFGPKNLISRNIKQLNDPEIGALIGGKALPVKVDVESVDGFFIYSDDTFVSDENKEVTQKDVLIANKLATQYTLTYKSEEPYISVGDVIIVSIVENNDRKYAIALLDPQYENIFNQILSTFLFLE
jgi:hypothetical protein